MTRDLSYYLCSLLSVEYDRRDNAQIEEVRRDLKKLLEMKDQKLSAPKKGTHGSGSRPQIASAALLGSHRQQQKEW